MIALDLVIFFLELAVMLATALLGGQLARKFQFPAVLGELVGGIILGPTVWGMLSPGSHAWLFPTLVQNSEVFLGRDGLIQICMLFFLFAAGLEMNLGIIKKRGKNIAWTSFMGIAIPFALGFGLVLLFPGIFGSHVKSHLWLFALFMGTALSISALPVIARILMDLNLMRSDMGMVIMGAATIDDLIGWSLFALILSNFASDSVLHLQSWMSLILVLLMFAFMLTVGRFVGKRAYNWLKAHLPWPSGFLGITMVVVLVMAAIAMLIGIEAIFGAFLVGVALSSSEEKRNEAHEMVYQFVICFFAPLFFVSIGLKVNFIESFDWLLVLVILLVACAGKIIGASLGAKISGLPFKQALAVGFAMNARGAMEMILASVALEFDLIDERIFVALVIMALVTSILSGPVINRLKIGEMKVGKPVYAVEKKPAKEVSMYTLETKSVGKDLEYQAVYEMDAEHADAVLPPSEAHSGYAGMANFEDPTQDYSIEGGRYKPKE